MDQISSLSNKEDKMGTRRATHNEVERRRRDNINNWIMKLSKLIPDCSQTGDSGGAGGQAKQSQSKGGILAKACEFLAEMRNTNQRLAESIKQTEEANQENERLSSQIEQLQVGDKESKFLNPKICNKTTQTSNLSFFVTAKVAVQQSIRSICLCVYLCHF